MKIQSHHDVPRYAWLTPGSSDPAVHAMRITTSTGIVDLTRGEFEQLATLLAEDVRARAAEEVQLHLREPRDRPRRVRLRLALAAVCAVFVVPLAACGTGGPSTEASPSSSASSRVESPLPARINPDAPHIDPYDLPPVDEVACIPQGALNSYASAAGDRDASYLAVRDMLRAVQTRKWEERSWDENDGWGGCHLVGYHGFACIPAELAQAAVEAGAEARPRMAAEIEAAVFFRWSRPVSSDTSSRRDTAPGGAYSNAEMCVSRGSLNEPWLPDSRLERFAR